ncbi:hypothetical protein SAMN05660845_0781 [Flavobacterium swingsii]|jgi:hypothetical protein|uniref:Nicotinate-nucleotide adenylyltransferase n=1 Tax=Flavobacterium swingsii TaxID=498292 RepID=A0A1I0WI34_9FLAO|nr:hypothetical protein [Flavobacterium swingsii]SFA88047.1 hypothetical protein SAMN05660845_0781 [Flavobacterium swingsii]
MKLLFSVLALLCFSTVSYSQSLEDEELKYNELPAIVMKTAGKDFSIYLPDRNPDEKVRQMQEKFIGYDLGKDYEGYNEYLVVMEAENAYLAATYNENGKLMSVVENYTNVKLPRQVIFSVFKSYPGWTIVKDKFLYTQEDGDIIKKQYNLKIKKDKEIKKLIVQPNGNIIAGL